MTGKELLEKLQALSSEELQKEVLIAGENKWREACYSSITDIRMAIINEDGEEIWDEDDEDQNKKGDLCICIED